MKAYKVGVDLAVLGEGCGGTGGVSGVSVCQARGSRGRDHNDRLADMHVEIRGAIIIVLNDCDRTVGRVEGVL